MEGKASDVSRGVALVEGATINAFELALMISGDADFVEMPVRLERVPAWVPKAPGQSRSTPVVPQITLPAKRRPS